MSTNDSTPETATENTDDRDDTMILEVVATDAPPLFRPPAPEKPEASASASGDASVPLIPPAAEEPPAPVRVAELAPAETGVEAPRTRWAAVVWGLFFAVLPDEKTVEAICGERRKLCEKTGLSGTEVLAEHLHVTLWHVGDDIVPPTSGEIDALMQRAGAVEAPPFQIS
ncbi:MAG: hypothetical protein IE935_09225, partial [Micrococcales bacterium]|nr:hypothetical protein [Micrococcales bacterium]